MTERPLSSLPGIEAGLAELLRARPSRAVTGFAPGGRVSTHQWGTNRSIFRGRGMEFDESRIYQPGDDVKSIDWRVTARTGDVHTKLFHEERERPVYIVVDLRSMMQFGSRVRFKSHLAAEIAAMLAWVGHDGGDSVGGFVMTREGRHDFPASRTRAGLLKFLDAISVATAPSASAAPEAGAAGVSFATVLQRLRHVCRPGTLTFIISDYADFDDTAERELRRLSLQAHITNIFVHDPLDARLPPRGGRLSDGEEVLSLARISAGKLDAYAAAFAERRQRIEKMSRQRGMAFLALQTSDDAKSVLRPERSKNRHRRTMRRTA